MKRIVIGLFILAMIAWAIPAEATSGFKRVGLTGFAFLKVAQGARPAGMGDAFSAVADDINAVYWNPAGLTQIERFQYTLSYNRWIVESKFYSGAVAFRWGRAALGFTVVNFSPEEVEETTIFQPNGTGKKLKLGDVAVGGLYALKMTDKLSFGAHFRYIQETLHEDPVKTTSFDVGSLFHTGFHTVRVGMSLKNFGRDIRTRASAAAVGQTIVTFTMPLVFNIAAAMEVYGKTEDPTHVTVALENLFAIDANERYHLGTEVWLGGIVALRAGYKFRYDEEGFSGGAGLKHTMKGKTVSVDFSYTDFGSRLTAPLRFTLGGSF